MLIPVKRFLDGMHKWQLEVLKDFDQRKHRFFLINWHRRARKTTLAVNILIKEACKNANCRYGYITSTYRAAKNIVWTDPNMIKAYLPMDHVEKINESELYVKFKNGSILSIHGADQPDSIRGVDFAGVVLDEYPLIKSEVWDEIIQPIIRQDTKRWAIFIFTPKGQNHAFHQWVKAANNPDWKRYELKASQSQIIPPEELEKAKAETPERLYLQEFECEFSDNASSVFRGISGCMFGTVENYIPGRSYVTGVDLAKTQDWTVIMTICRETKHVVSFQRFNQVDWNLQKERIITECIKYRSQLCIDATGVGDPIVDDLRRAGLNIPEGGAYKFTSDSKKSLIERLIISIEQRLITFPKIEELMNELSAFSYEITPNRNIRYTAPDGIHDDCVIALALCVYGVRNFLYSDNSEFNEMPEQTLITGSVY